MSRPLRIEFAGAVYHVMARGNGRERIFRSDDDYRVFLAGLAKTCTRFDWLVWAYCLMGNHYHLLLQTQRPTLSQGMRELNGVYTQAFNRRHRRVGHVLQGRYKAVLIEKDSYLLELSRYVVLNPVRARVCETAADWPWSSYRAVVGRAGAAGWLAAAATLELFGNNRRAARSAYARFVADGVDAPDPSAEVAGQLFLGGEQFVAQVTKRLKTTSREVPRAQRQWRTLAQFEREARDRNAAIRAAYASGAYTLRAIGEHFGLHYATVSRIARQGEMLQYKT
jgi:REP-associated tyrosine transposase